MAAFRERRERWRVWIAASSLSDRSRERLRNARCCGSYSWGCDGGFDVRGISARVLFFIGRFLGAILIGQSVVLGRMIDRCLEEDAKVVLEYE